MTWASSLPLLCIRHISSFFVLRGFLCSSACSVLHHLTLRQVFKHGTNHSFQARRHLPSFFNRSSCYSSFHCRQRRSSHGPIFERLKFMQRIWLYALQPRRSSGRLLLPILHYDMYSLQQLDISYLLSFWLRLQTNTTSLVRHHPTKFDSAPTEPTPQYAVGWNSAAVRWFLLSTGLFVPKRAVHNGRSE